MQKSRTGLTYSEVLTVDIFIGSRSWMLGWFRTLSPFNYFRFFRLAQLSVVLSFTLLLTTAIIFWNFRIQIIPSISKHFLTLLGVAPTPPPQIDQDGQLPLVSILGQIIGRELVALFQQQRVLLGSDLAAKYVELQRKQNVLDPKKLELLRIKERHQE